MKSVKALKNRTGKRKEEEISDEEYARRIEWYNSMNFKPNKYYNNPKHRGKYTSVADFVRAHEEDK